MSCIKQIVKIQHLMEIDMLFQLFETNYDLMLAAQS